MKYLHVDITDSTNTYAVEHESEFESLTMIYCNEQTAGRGQRGNHWESEPGKNLTFSVVYRPEDFPASAQFAISEAAALGIADALGELGVEAKVKWPNDIYVGDSKICGILIENALLGVNLLRSVIGVGINVNQRVFLSDAPNPVSVCNITGHEANLDAFRQIVGQKLDERLGALATASGREGLHQEFKRRLWRADGNLHPFLDVATGERYEGCVEDVEPAGYLIIRDSFGHRRRYAFKEVEWILSANE